MEEKNIEMPINEEVEDILDKEIFPSDLILKREIIYEAHHIKLLQINNHDNFKIKSETISTIVKRG